VLCRKLKAIDLSNNNLTQVPATVLSGLLFLEDLSLATNLLQSLPARVFKSLPNIKVSSLTLLNAMFSSAFSFLLPRRRPCP
jgi:Leucine-rich repeat (LRR) protein